MLLCSSEGLIQRRMLLPSLPCLLPPACPPAHLPGPARLVREREKSFGNWGQLKAASAFLFFSAGAAECQPRFHYNPESIMRGHSHHFAWTVETRPLGEGSQRATRFGSSCSLQPAP